MKLRVKNVNIPENGEFDLDLINKKVIEFVKHLIYAFDEFVDQLREEVTAREGWQIMRNSLNNFIAERISFMNQLTGQSIDEQIKHMFDCINATIRFNKEKSALEEKQRFFFELQSILDSEFSGITKLVAIQNFLDFYRDSDSPEN